jgi:hypothetical protein
LYTRSNVFAPSTSTRPAGCPGGRGSADVTLHQMLAHVLAETNRHAGNAGILREQLDGAAGMTSDNSNLPKHDTAWWENYRARIGRAARTAEPDKPCPRHSTNQTRHVDSSARVDRGS